jgi:hypothetical protein
VASPVLQAFIWILIGLLAYTINRIRGALGRWRQIPPGRDPSPV